MMKIDKLILGILTLTVVSCSSVKKMSNTSTVATNPQKVELKKLSDKKQQEFEYLFIEAIKQRRIGEADKAVGLLSNCLEIDPKSATAMYELSNIHIQKRDFTSAMLLLEKATKINPNNDWYQILLAQIYQKNKEYSKASVLLTHLAEKNPENLNYLYLNALLLREAKQYDKAIEQYQKIEQQIGFSDQLVVERQKILLEKGDKKGAVKELKQLIKQNKDEAKYYGLMADLYLSIGEKQEALENYTKILELEPDNGFVQLSLANYWFGEKNKEKALEHAKKGLINKKLETENKLRFFQIIRIEKEKHQLSDDELASLLTLLMAGDTKDVGIYAYYIDYLLEKQLKAKDTEKDTLRKEVRIHLRRFVKLYKDDAQKWQQLLFIENDMADTIALYNESKQAIKYHKRVPLFYILHAFSATQQGLYQEALEALDKGEPFSDGNPAMKAQFPLNRAEVYYKQEMKDKAFAEYDKALQLNPNDYMALNNYAYYLSLEEGSDLDKAEKMSGRVIAAHPTNATYLDTYAWILFMKGDYRLAKFYMESALSNDKTHSGVLIEHYGDILFKLGKVEEAIENWKKARDKGVKSKTLERKIKNKQYYK